MAGLLPIRGMCRLALFGAVGAWASPVSAQDCSAFVRPQSVEQKAPEQAVEPFQSDLLARSDAIPCLLGMLTSLKGAMVSLQPGDPELSAFVRVTGGLRTIIANSGIPAIQRFREADDLDVIAALAAGARLSNKTARVNAALILSDVIDNAGICVVLDHLYDTSLAETAEGRSGRLNLLGVASVVAPWAYRENYDNLRRLEAYLQPIVSSEGDAHQTLRVLGNLSDRLDFQNRDPGSNKNANLPPDLRQCYAYVPGWANKTGEQLVYRD